MAMATNTFAGVGFLLLGFLATVITAALIASRRKWAQVIMDHYIRSARQASRPAMQWLWFAWRAQKWDDQDYRRRMLHEIWIPVIAIPIMLGLVAFGAAAAHL
jgi:hypothetical protein